MLSSSRCAKVVTAACADACDTPRQAMPRNKFDRRSVLRAKPADTTARTCWRAQPHVELCMLKEPYYGRQQLALYSRILRPCTMGASWFSAAQVWVAANAEVKQQTRYSSNACRLSLIRIGPKASGRARMS